MPDCDFENKLTNYAGETAKRLMETDFKKLALIAGKLIETKQTGASVFTAGNGGSSATASHMVNDLAKGLRVHNRAGLKAFCLSDPNALVTCLANDFDYSEIFVIQLQTYAKPGDILVAFSGSGNSANVVNALKYAKRNGIYTIGFGGGDGGAMSALCEICLLAPTGCMEMLEDMHLMYEHALITVMREALKDAFDIEIIYRPALKNGRPGFPFGSVLFDFDGTVSLIREGWQQIMIPYFTEVIMETERAGDYETEKDNVTEFVDMLTGKQTIFQCMKLAEEVAARGGRPLAPAEYKKEYLRRLAERIRGRKDGLRDGSLKPADFMVTGCVEFFAALKSEGAELFLASGTDEKDVLDEAGLLGVTEYFGGNIFGATDAQTDCSKEAVIKNILASRASDGGDLLSFGDGFVEIELVKNAGGYSVAVATDEKRRAGIDEWKRERLLSAGADAVIPDFGNAARLMDFLKRRV